LFASPIPKSSQNPGPETYGNSGRLEARKLYRNYFVFCMQTHYLIGPCQKRVALYLRVSTTEQTVENQHRELKAVAERHGWSVVAVFTDAGISGTKGSYKRPGYDRLCRGLARREFDEVAAWSVDRLGRSLQELVGFLGELHAKDVDL
jgi:predicted site-specific integrase-resolvase